MENKTKTEIMQLSGLIASEMEFLIPTYQRLYSWKKEQVNGFLEDIFNAQNSYFIGNIIVKEIDKYYHLIDGQQRLSTILFLCIAICKKYLSKDDIPVKDTTPDGEYLKNLFKFAFLRENKNDALNDNCYDRSRINMPLRKNDEQALFWYSFTDIKNQNITNAINAINEFCKDKELKEISEAINKIFFNFIELSDEVQVNQYFVRLNSAGVQLDATDILKARLLKRIADSDENVARYAAIWDECSQMQYFAEFDDKNSSAVLEPKKISEIINGNQALENHTSNQKEREEFKSIIDFPTFVLHVFKILFGDEVKINKSKFLENTWEIFNKQNNTTDKISAKDVLETLQEYRLIFDKFVIKKKKGDDYYYFYEKDGKNKAGDEVKNLEIMQNYLRVARTGENRNYHHFLTKYLEFCRDKDDCELSEKNAKECLDFLKNIDDCLAWQQLNIENKLNENSDILNDFISKKSIEEIKGFTVNQSIDLNRDFAFLNNGTATPHYWFYRLEYLLLTSDLFGENSGDIFINYRKNYQFRHLNSIEHIHAQHEENGSELDDGMLHSFGNLALINSSENSSFSNQSFVKKKDDFKNKKIKNLKLFLVFQNNSWLAEQITSHHNKMLQILQNSLAI